MRLFVSIDLPGELTAEVATLQGEFEDASGLRFTDPDQAHLTLKFLGDVDEDRVDEVGSALSRAVERADVGPFTAEFGGFGVFPSLDYISVVWLGVREGADELARLHEAIERETVALGFEPERHAFTPHVTLARMEHAGGKELVREGVRTRNPTVGSMAVTDVRLTRSTPTADGPDYSTVDRVPL